MIRLLVAIMLTALCGIANAGGRETFDAHCLICHQANAKGVPGMYPPLADSIGSYVKIPAGRAYLVHVVSWGLTGAIAVHGQSFDGVMQPWPFTDEEAAQVLNYVLSKFNGNLLPGAFAPFTADEVKKYRTTSMTPGAVHKEREVLMRALAASHAGDRL